MTAAPVVAISGGSGQLGRGLSLRLASAGVLLIVGSRNHATAEQAAGELMEAVLGAHVRGVLNIDAVRARRAGGACRAVRASVRHDRLDP